MYIPHKHIFIYLNISRSSTNTTASSTTLDAIQIAHNNTNLYCEAALPAESCSAYQMKDNEVTWNVAGKGEGRKVRYGGGKGGSYRLNSLGVCSR